MVELVKKGTKKASSKSEEAKMFERNATHITEFFDEMLGKYKKGEILNFVIIAEGELGEFDDIETFAITHSSGRHLQGLLEDATITIRRREWGEDEGVIEQL